MAVSSVNGYQNTLYKWQAQQLKTNSNSSSSSSSSNQLTSLFSGSSMVNQISSMVELTKYAMDAMGVSSSGKVTFSQITKYREQLQSEFSQGVKQGMQDTGIGNLPGISYSLDKNGVLSAIGSNAEDRKKAQAWLDANPQYGKELLAKLSAANIEFDQLDLGISSTGRITLTDKTSQTIQTALNQNDDLRADLLSGLKEANISIPSSLELKFDTTGALVASGDDSEQINAWLKENPEFANSVKAVLEKNNIESGALTLRISQDSIQADVANSKNGEIQAILDKENSTGKTIYNSLNNMGIDKNVTFSLQVNEDGSLQVISDHPDRDKVQKFFDEHPELVKKFRQIETLAGIDDARKAMQISPAEMRKRVQIESMAAWWETSDSNTSYFGQYDSGQLSMLAGLNLSV